jgi:hypothetical protein
MRERLTATRNICRSFTFALLLGGAVLASPSARAWESFESWTGSDGTTFSLYWQEGSDGKSHFAVYWEKDGIAHVNIDDAVTAAVIDKIAASNPNPDGSSKGTEPIDVAALLKKTKGLALAEGIAPEDSPLAKWITADGFGYAAHGNPGDTDGGNKGPGLTPKIGAAGGLTPKQQAARNRLINELAKSNIQIGQTMGTGDEGGLESAPTIGPNNGGGKGKGTGSGNGNGPGSNKVKYVQNGEALGPRPDLVNPPLRKMVGKIATSTKTIASTKTIVKTGGAKLVTLQASTSSTSPSTSGGSSKVIGAGLLEADSGFGRTGVSGVGTPIATGGSKTSAGAGLR